MIRIEDLPVPLDQGAAVYDVHFRYQSGVTVYGANLDNFDFTQEEDVLVALAAVMDALNAEGSVPETAGVPTEDQFFIGGEEDDGFVAALGSEFFAAIWEECETGCLLLGTAILPASQKFTYADFVLAGDDPPDDPPGVRSGFQGLPVVP